MKPPSTLFLLLVAFVLFMSPSYGLIPPGKGNPYYLIESYYGSRSKEYYSSNAILNDKPTTFQWCTNFDYDPSKGRMYFANRITHTIQFRDLRTDEIVTVAGIESFSGHRNGDFGNTLFNSPTALKIFRYDRVRAQNARNAFTIILNSDSLPCQYATYSNYTNCEDDNSDERIVDPNLIKTLHPPFDSSSTTEQDMALEQLSGKILYVMDRENSCIRKLNLEKNISETFAGTCGTSGFMDGPPEINLFNKPDSFGMDDLGNLFVLDAGNQYVRIVNQTGFTYTLIKGACDIATQRTGTQIVDNLNTRFVTCYRNWIKTSGLPNSHIFTDLTDLQKCFKNDVMCGGKDRSHPILYKNSTFRGSFGDDDGNSRRLSSNNI